MSLTDEQVKDFQLKANDIRISIIEMLAAAKSGHSAGPLGMADVFTYLYFHALKHDPKNPTWVERDRFILSNGHICPVYYATLAHSGYFPVEELLTLRKLGTRLQGHPHREWLPVVETSSGPLGCGLSQACGMALAERMDNGVTSKKKFYTFMGDGELQEGNIWEAVMLAGKYKLHNMVGVVDYNNIQIEGYLDDVMPLSPMKEKWESFNWHVIEVDGHDFRALDTAFEQAKTVFEKPTVILARTIPGKGVSFMEGNYKWHGNPPGITDVTGAPPKAEQVAIALADLNKIKETLQ